MVFSPGNMFSVLVFFLWVPIAIWGAHRWPPAKTGALLMLLPLMFLPELVNFNLPGLPAFGKLEVATFWLLIAVLLFHRQRLRTVELNRWTKLIIPVFLGASVVTVFLNRDPIAQGHHQLSGHHPYDAVTTVIDVTLHFVLPFVLGAALFKDARDLRVLFRILVGATLVYAVFQLIEVRLSPQFNTWVYGFFQHRFEQMKRGGGFRSIVFMAHGLTVAMFTMTGILAAATLQKSKSRVFRVNAIWATAFLCVVLLLNKSVGAFLYTLIAAPLILFFSPKTQFRVAMALAVIVLTYPALRGADVIPVEGISSMMAEQFGEERAASLMVRLTNEKALLERALERPFFGWGRFGRFLIYDPESGRLSSVADGEWIVTLGTSGFVGFFSKYLFLLSPIFWAARQTRYLPRQADRRLVSALALMIGFSAFNMLPNSSSHSFPFLFSGALLSCSRGMVRDASRQRQLKRQRAEMRQLHARPPSAPA
jgi:hypothetical protein